MRVRLLALLLAVAAGSALAQQGRLHTPGPFDRLQVSGSTKVELVQGSADQVFVTGDENVQRNVKISLDNGRLHIRNEDDRVFWNRSPVQLRVQMREVNQLMIAGFSEVRAPKAIKAGDLRISIAGHGVVQLQELTAERLRFDISGAGDADLAGQVDELVLNVSGKGTLTADKLLSRRAALNFSGIGSADVWVIDDLKIGVSGVASVNYWGKPMVHRKEAGVANVNAKGEKK